MIQFSLWCQRNVAVFGLLLGMAIVASLVAIRQLPLQLLPNVDLPEISIVTLWRAASPKEMEVQIAVPQEKVLRGIPGLKRIQTDLLAGSATITMTFRLGTDINESLIEVVSRLSRAPALPGDAEEPVITTNGALNGNVAGTFIIKTKPGNTRHVNEYIEYVEDAVMPRFQQLPGIASVSFDNDLRTEVRITVDPYLIAHLDIGIAELKRLINQRQDVTGGVAEVGRRQYMVRLSGAESIEELGNAVLKWRNGQPVYLRDIATISYQHARQTLTLRQNGRDALMLIVRRATGSNVVDILDDSAAVVDELNHGEFGRRGLTIENSLDTSVFIRRAVIMVFSNLVIGVVLAVAVLWWFLRNYQLTFAIAASIPVSLLISVLVLRIFDLSLNVISLAGLAFAVGLILDASIVIAESAVRHSNAAKNLTQGINKGVSSVAMALFASTVTTVAVLAPILLIGGVEGQIFKDLAIALIAGVTLSLVIAMTMLPMLLGLFKGTLDNSYLQQNHARQAKWLADLVMRINRKPQYRWVLIITLLLLPLVLALKWIPEADYLPPANYDQIGTLFSISPGYNLPTLHQELGDQLDSRLMPYFNGEKQPRLKSFLLYLSPEEGYLGIRTQEPDQIDEMMELVKNDISTGFADVDVFTFRTPIFSNFGVGRNIDIDIHSQDLKLSQRVAREAGRILSEVLPEAYVAPVPDLANDEPELRFTMNEARATEFGLAFEDLGDLLKAYTEGLYLNDFFDGQRRRDVILDVPGWQSPDQLLAIPVATASGVTLPLRELASVKTTSGPRELRRINYHRTVTLQITPPENLSLEDTLSRINEQVLPTARAMLQDQGVIEISGSADRLTTLLSTMGKNFVYALLLLVILLTLLFKSLRDSLLVVLTIPLALAGGVGALHMVNLFTFQSMDLLTMVGFVILLGLVVNNAVLLINETHHKEREGASRNVAIRHAIQVRYLPILMTTLTSIFGMLPMLLSVADGAQVYRGIAAVIIGGMSTNTIFVFFLLPALMHQRKFVEQIDPAAEQHTDNSIGNRHRGKIVAID